MHKHSLHSIIYRSLLLIDVFSLQSYLLANKYFRTLTRLMRYNQTLNARNPSLPHARHVRITFLIFSVPLRVHRISHSSLT